MSARPIPSSTPTATSARGDGLSGPWDTYASLDTYLARARPAGIDCSVLLAPLTSDYDRANRDIAALLRQQPHRFLAFAFVNPVTDRGQVAEMVGHGGRAVGLQRHQGPLA